MKLKREELLEALTKVQPGLATKELIQQSQSFVFSKRRITTYNDEISVSCKFESDIEGVVKADELYQLLDKTKAKEIEVSIDGNILLMKTKNSKAGINIESDVNLPIDDIEEGQNKKELPEDFIDGLKFCMFSASKDITKQILTCILAKDNYILSCDNYRLTEYKLKDGNYFKKPILVPVDTAKKLIAYKPKEYAISKSNNWLHFYSDDVTFSCRTFAKRYPDTSLLQRIEGVDVIIPNKIKDVLERALIFVKGHTEQDEYVKVTLKNNTITIYSVGIGGWFEEKRDIKYKSNAISFLINPTLFIDSINLLNNITIGKTKIKLNGDNFIHVVSLIAE